MSKKDHDAAAIERRTQTKESAYVLRLFITGATPNSLRAVENIKQICEQYLAGSYALEVIDVYQQYAIAAQEQLVALPLLVKKLPLPERRLIGDLSDTAKVLKGLGLENQ